MRILKSVVMVLCFVWLSLLRGTIREAGAQGTKALLLFGESDHQTFLGCLNCADTSNVSLCNSVGKYGSSVARDSIWNSVGRFGSDVSPVSPWNSVSSNAPIVVAATKIHMGTSARIPFITTARESTGCWQCWIITRRRTT